LIKKNSPCFHKDYSYVCKYFYIGVSRGLALAQGWTCAE